MIQYDPVWRFRKIKKNKQPWLFQYYTGWWFHTFFIFPYIGNFIIPADELIFFRGVETRYTCINMYLDHDNIYSSMHTTIMAIMGYCKYGDSIDIQYMIMTTYMRTYLRTYVSTYLYPDNTYTV